MTELLVVTSKIKEAVSAAGMNCASDTPDAVSAMVSEAVKKAVKRAQANGRKTVRPEDF